MVQLTRRTLLRVSTGLTALTLAESIFSTLPAGWSSTSTTTTIDPVLKSRWGDIITGRHQVVPSDPRFATALSALDTRVSGWRAMLDTTAASVFTDLPVTGANPDAQGVRIAQKIRQSYTRLLDFAMAWATPGSVHHGDATLLTQIASGLGSLSVAGYASGTTMAAADNWWDWQIGSPRSLASILVLIGDELPAAQVNAGCAAIDHFVPDPWFLDPLKGLPVKESTGANRMDMCQTVIVRALLDGDVTRLERARAGLAPVWATVLEGDGFHADGSMIQHGSVPYTGSYGIELLLAAARLFALLDLGGAGPEYEAFFDLIGKSYFPIVYRGRVMDNVRGRAVARPLSRSQDAGFAAAEGLLLLAQAAPAATALQVRGRVRAWVDEDTAGRIFSTGTVARTGLVVALTSSAVAAVPEPTGGATVFNAMARCIVRDPGRAIAISASSSAIAWYECSTTENIRGYHAGSGMTSVYDADTSHYDDEFWPTVDRYRLAGTTVEQLALPDRIGGTSGKGRPPGEWTGGSTVMADFSAAATVFAQDLYAPHDRAGTGGAFRGSDMHARKAWFLHDGVLVALGADISSSTGGIVETVVENRNLHAGGANALRVDGVVRIGTLPSSRTDNATGPLSVHIDGVGGYFFPVGGSVKMKREERTGSWADINTTAGTDATPHTRRYLTLWLWHGQNFSGRSYQYAVLPGASLAQTQAFAAAPSFAVLENSDACQAVRFPLRSTRLFAFWQAKTVDQVTASAPCTVALSTRADGAVIIAIDQHAASASALAVTVAGLGTLSSSTSTGGAVVAAGSGVSVTLAAGSRHTECVLFF